MFLAHMKQRIKSRMAVWTLFLRSIYDVTSIIGLEASISAA